MSEHVITASRIDYGADQETIIDISTGALFDADRYSRFKHGSRQAAQEMGHEVGKALIAGIPELISDNRPPEAIVCYQGIPPACQALTAFAMSYVNLERIAEGNDPARILHVRKSHEIRGNYASLTPEQRLEQIFAIELDTDGHSFDGANVLALDDIRITGTAEKHVRHMLSKHRPNRSVYGYLAIFDESAALQDASVESRINLSTINTLEDVNDMIDKDGFIVNLRVIKKILSEPSPEKRAAFMDRLSDADLYDTLAASLTVGPEFLTRPEYSSGYRQLVASVKQRQLLA